MAIFLTPKTKENMTAGERRFAGIMDLYLNDDYLIWYNIPSRNKRRYPDFLIFNPHIGLICLEIKDWSYSSLRSINSDTVTLQTAQGIRENTHPLKQARDILFDFVNQLTQSPQLRHKNSLKFPYAYGAVMVNLKRSDIPDEHKDSFERIFSSEKTLYHEDIHNNPQNLETFLKNLMPFHSVRSITSDDISQIRGNIFPELVLDRETIAIQSSENQNNITFAEHLKVMDLEQEKFARQLGGGHRVIHGVAGSGKTVILQHRAKVLAETPYLSSDAELPTVLVLCYNKTLASYLKSKLNHHSIDVLHFHSWCIQLKERFNIRVPYKKDNYYNTLSQKVMEYVLQNHESIGKYQAILIDEGHDFEADWFKALTLLLKPEGHLLLLYDDAQDIYNRRTKGLNFSLSSVGIKARGRTTIFKINYRNSQEIQQFSTQFLESFLNPSSINEMEENIPLLHAESAGKPYGHFPEFHLFSHATEESQWIIQKIKQWQSEGVSLSEIALLTIPKKGLKAIAQSLETYHIPFLDLTDEQNRLDLVNQKDRVILCTVHSSKGLEFKKVILCHCDKTQNMGAEISDADKSRILYIGMTRAQEELYMLAQKDNLWTQTIKKVLTAQKPSG